MIKQYYMLITLIIVIAGKKKVNAPSEIERKLKEARKKRVSSYASQ